MKVECFAGKSCGTIVGVRCARLTANSDTREPGCARWVSIASLPELKLGEVIQVGAVTRFRNAVVATTSALEAILDACVIVRASAVARIGVGARRRASPLICFR